MMSGQRLEMALLIPFWPSQMMALGFGRADNVSSTPKPRPYQLRYVRQLASRLREQTVLGLSSSVTHVASFHCKS